MVQQISMVDLKGQYEHIKTEIDEAIQKCVSSALFINGPEVKEFEKNFQEYLGASYVITCANGTDALQLAFMSLDLQPGDEVIVPAFTYVATAEVIALLGLVPVMVDVDPDTFNITADAIEQAITNKTKAVVPVHLFGQCADMETIVELCKKHKLYIVEDNAQSIGATYAIGEDRKAAGLLGHIGTTSFFPSKNLGCYGDGGAVLTNNRLFAEKVRQIANHGQAQKYKHDVVGINSRLDTIQASILLQKLKKLDAYIVARQKAAAFYDAELGLIPQVQIPERNPKSTHVFHQYTLKVPAERRDGLKEHLQGLGIPSMVYYPIPLAEQFAYKNMGRVAGDLSVTSQLCQQVISLPMHTELDDETLMYITNSIRQYFEHK
jgi:UDP-2-acetamido-2-deoxy-ribo-hexuluronate aminotransferase